MNIGQIESEFNKKLSLVYDSAEAGAITNLVLADITGMDRMNRRMHPTKEIEPDQQEYLTKALADLQRYKPVQYVLGKAWFWEMEMKVNEAVLIPRPETEELVQWVLDEKFKFSSPAILDIGTGSGCIPIALKINWPKANVFALDVSEAALAVAKENADKQSASIQLFQCDILDPVKWPAQKFDIIISNPPYIPENESGQLEKNVTDWEPHLALFVADNDPLLFYKSIGGFAKSHLNTNGALFFECHQQYVKQVLVLLKELGFEAQQKADMFGNDRMVKATITTEN